MIVTFAGIVSASHRRTTRVARLTRRDFILLVWRAAEIRQDLLGLNLAFAKGCEVVGYRFLCIEADLPRVGADKSFIEDAAGQLVEVFLFEGAQHTDTDLGGVGNGLEREPALLALFAKFFAERSHERLRRAQVIGARMKMPSS